MFCFEIVVPDFILDIVFDVVFGVVTTNIYLTWNLSMVILTVRKILMERLI